MATVEAQICGCPRDALCDACVTQRGAWLTGTAALRGERWGRAVAARATPSQRAQSWPPYEGEAVARAIAKVRDLSVDRRLLKLLGRVVHGWAAAEWSGELAARRPAYPPPRYGPADR